ncbi:hypothetical protein L596_028659 [Steinernema carpocapsae]|uniref:RING-type domain-containing protein n=1 Tax=Steinernema carpocapsae TaxID=34508 RepID=A0A4V6XVN6_STECR|nr:hypothetical protein L596_028659 [Steinernema carpocapsae]
MSDDSTSLLCSACSQRFRNPVILPCGHSACKSCVENFTRCPERDCGRENVSQAMCLLTTVRETLTCAICQDLITNPVETDCGHMYCYDCLYGGLQNDSCPICRKHIEYSHDLKKSYALKDLIELCSHENDQHNFIENKALAAALEELERKDEELKRSEESLQQCLSRYDELELQGARAPVLPTELPEEISFSVLAQSSQSLEFERAQEALEHRVPVADDSARNFSSLRPPTFSLDHQVRTERSLRSETEEESFREQVSMANALLSAFPIQALTPATTALQTYAPTPSIESFASDRNIRNKTLADVPGITKQLVQNFSLFRTSKGDRLENAKMLLGYFLDDMNENKGCFEASLRDDFHLPVENAKECAEAISQFSDRFVATL